MYEADSMGGILALDCMIPLCLALHWQVQPQLDNSRSGRTHRTVYPVRNRNLVRHIDLTSQSEIEQSRRRY